MMKARDYTSLICSVLGLYMIYESVLSLIGIPELVYSFSQYASMSPSVIPTVIEYGLAILASFGIGVFLIIYSKRLAESIFPSSADNNDQPITAPELMRAGFGSVGLIILIQSIPRISAIIGYFYARPALIRDLNTPNDGLVGLLDRFTGNIKVDNITVFSSL